MPLPAHLTSAVLSLCFALFCCVCQAAERGDVEQLEWLHAHYHLTENAWDASASTAAASNGHLSALQWAAAKSYPLYFPQPAYEGAAKGGHVEVLEWVRPQKPEGPKKPLFCVAAAQGQQTVLLWLLEHYPADTCRCKGSAFQCAASGGHTELQQWLHAHFPEAAAV